MKGWTTASIDPLAQLRVNRRLVIVTVLMLLALGGVVARFAYLQLASHDALAARAENNRVRLQAVAPNRGLILDRHGRVLAENRAAYRLVVVPERVEDRAAMLDAVDGLVGLSDEERERFALDRMRSRPFQPVTLKTNLTEDEVAALALKRHRLEGLEIEPYLTRHYPHGEALSHVIGYVARLDASDLDRLDPDDYRATTHTGKTGIERYYEDLLHGTSGVERVETNAQGRVVRVLERVDPIPGEDLRLNIDLDLQLTALEALGTQSGAVVALDVATGEVLALVSKPGYDPNDFVNGISSSAYRALLENPYRPLFNRFLSGGYEPGSTIKPFIALAGLESGRITPQTRVFSSGVFRLPGHSREYRDWREGGHGWVDLRASLEQSVNVYFYQLANDLGIDAISRELALFGLGQPTGIDLRGEFAGVLPSRSWKRRELNEPWFPGETVITGIGQGFTVVTPLQLAWMTAALAGRGHTAPPRLVGRAEPVRVIAHDPADWDAVFDGLEAVIVGARGTARAIAAEVPVPLAGKTGTAQVFGRPQDGEDEDDEELPEFLRNHALFIGFAPVDAPRVAVAVVAEHGGGGATVAAPVAARVIARAVGAPDDRSLVDGDGR
ncbi:penicillin-binding protein 2 [Wenzhouxiangella sp. XN79A]|uniref:penicillin-binding protein 2 n=1 Tax=Wenzhouxiangella sp. XN79A TaxID=2724193 RepID=UPI00144AE205|nr:penicillin-binding protein 2 [Wenzhouxiangella sp. XN79A]NKI33962.1 penicillin-binding protein 2 [Wenzhouxiangella sp. XN79A]